MNRRPSSSLLAAVLSALAAGCAQERTCPADQVLCGDVCVSLQSDALHCGACGRSCGDTQCCSGAACVDGSAAGSACGTAVVAACFNLGQVRPLASNLAPAGAPIATDAGPMSFATQASGALFVANDMSSTLSRISLPSHSATTGASALPVPLLGAGYADLGFVTAHGTLLYASNSAAGALAVVDPASGVVEQVPLGAAAGEFVNPQGIAFVGERAYVALMAVNAVAVVDTAASPRHVMKRIDLSGLAFPGAQAGPARAVSVGSRVFVTLNDYYDASFKPVSGAHGRLAVIDAATDALAGDALDLGASCLNAGGLALRGTTLWVACGDSMTKAGAALVPVELAGSVPVVGAAVTLPHAAASVVFCGDRGYAGASDSGTVLAFDPGAHAVTAEAVACPAGSSGYSYVPDLACAN